MKPRAKGIYSALISAFFLGMAPIFGKQAILLGLAPLAVVAARTFLAALLLFIIMAIFYRNYLYIYPAGLLGCLLAGWTNGVGSLFYYSALGRLDAGLGHLLYSLYPLFLILWLSLDRQPTGWITWLRLLLALLAVFLLTWVRPGQVDPIGVCQMLIAASLYAFHLPINQRVLYDMPAPTVTLYTLLAMSSIVIPAFVFSNARIEPANVQAWGPVLGLTIVTFLSRLALFNGVKHLGGMQTALLGLGELLVTLSLSQLWLGERFSQQQWFGAAILTASLMFIMFDKTPGKKRHPGSWLSRLIPSPGDILQ
jgi:drug/metabolite transporter (DMT)-like permease